MWRRQKIQTESRSGGEEEKGGKKNNEKNCQKKITKKSPVALNIRTKRKKKE